MPLAQLRLRAHQTAAYGIPSALGRLPAPVVFAAQSRCYLLWLSVPHVAERLCSLTVFPRDSEQTWQDRASLPGLPLRRARRSAFGTAAPAGVFTLLQHLNSRACSSLSEDRFTIDCPEEAMALIPSAC